MKSKVALIITLGHSSSAMYYDGINKPIAYEEERLNRIKSTSAFPKLAIERILDQIDKDTLIGGTIIISHWYDNFSLSSLLKRRFDMDYIEKLIFEYDMKLVSLGKGFTHHDSHMVSSKVFFDEHHGQEHGKIKLSAKDDLHFMVMDGFGNNQEVISLYRQEHCTPGTSDMYLIFRVSGYKNSMGLMYQFATAFCGMKENQDEYKFLGYQSHIEEAIGLDGRILLEHIAKTQARIYFNTIVNNTTHTCASEFINLDELKQARTHWYKIFESVFDGIVFELEGIKDDIMRPVMAHFIQTLIEEVTLAISHKFNVKNVCLSGGCFYNVKLNNHILKNIEGAVSVIPLAGDQGAGIGIYEHRIGGFKFGDLCYGVRNLDYADKPEHARIMYTQNREEFARVTSFLLREGKIVNIVTGDMEFGPRALCNTSTLALPTKHNIDYINKMNKRNTVMPMAPVVLTEKANHLFSNKLKCRVIGSDQFMIITFDYTTNDLKYLGYSGVMHRYPDKEVYSGRPQIIGRYSVSPIMDILCRVESECLVNTSFNTHGNPILFTLDQCIDDFKKQLVNDTEEINWLIVYDEKD